MSTIFQMPQRLSEDFFCMFQVTMLLFRDFLVLLLGISRVRVFTTAGNEFSFSNYFSLSSEVTS